MTDATPRPRDDTAAIAAYAARYGLDADAAAADWRFLVERDRECFRERSRGVAGGKAPVEAEMTPGQAAYERWHANLRREFPGIAPVLWGELGGKARAGWGDVAGDAIDARVASIVRAAGGDTVIVAFKDPVGEHEAEEMLDRWREYGPDDSSLIIVESAAGIDVAAKAGPQAEIRTCYCGTTATVMRGVFPHPDCDGSVLREPQPAPGRQARQLDAALRGIAEIRNHVHDDLPDWADVQQVVDEVIAEINELADLPPAAPKPAPALAAAESGEMRAVIDMIWRMCQKPDGERLAERIAGLIKNSGMEPF
jgi:hypothetical protein